MGSVGIALVETPVEQDEDGAYHPAADATPVTDGLEFRDVMPGDTVPKDPTVVLDADSHDAYIRVRMEYVVPEGSTITEEDLEILDTALRARILEDARWYYDAGDDVYYYSEVLTNSEPDANAAALFTEVTIPGAWLNNTAGQEFRIALTAEAIQAENLNEVIAANTNADGQITGWGDAAAASDLN